MTRQKKAIICMLKTKVHDHELWKLQLDEIKKLAKSINYEIIDVMIQTKLHPHPAYVLGKGKIDELKEKVLEQDIETVIFWNNLTSKQSLNLIRTLSEDEEIDVKDRYDLTLEIFEKQATDKLSKIQIELARTRKELPLYKLQANIKYKKEKGGYHGLGEHGYHSKIKSYDKKVASLRREISKLKDNKIKTIENRKKRLYNSRYICIAGHYNAGKTTLFNKITGLDKKISDKPFTTLSSKYGRYKRGKDLFFIDSIGFVLDLDPRLIKSFELNLLDMLNADKMLYLIDASEEKSLLYHKACYGLDLLREIGINIIEKVIIIFNKIDKLKDSEEFIKKLVEKYPDPFKILPYLNLSAEKGINIDDLIYYLLNTVIDN